MEIRKPRVAKHLDFVSKDPLGNHVDKTKSAMELSALSDFKEDFKSGQGKLSENSKDQLKEMVPKEEINGKMENNLPVGSQISVKDILGGRDQEPQVQSTFQGTQDKKPVNFVTNACQKDPLSRNLLDDSEKQGNEDKTFPSQSKFNETNFQENGLQDTESGLNENKPDHQQKSKRRFLPTKRHAKSRKGEDATQASSTLEIQGEFQPKSLEKSLDGDETHRVNNVPTKNELESVAKLMPQENIGLARQASLDSWNKKSGSVDNVDQNEGAENVNRFPEKPETGFFEPEPNKSKLENEDKNRDIPGPSKCQEGFDVEWEISEPVEPPTPSRFTNLEFISIFRFKLTVTSQSSFFPWREEFFWHFQESESGKEQTKSLQNIKYMPVSI